MIEELKAQIIFEKEYRDPNCILGLEEFSHIWILWVFSSNVDAGWSPTVIPPRLGGKIHKGVCATRSPFRPNPLGLSCVRLERIEETDDGMELIVSGVDLLDGTPIYDIKPYIPYADCIPQASGGYTESTFRYRLEVDFPAHMLDLLPEDKRDAVIGCLAEDPRPSYQDDPQRIYSMRFMDYDVRFRVRDGVLTVTEVEVYRTSS